jgi:glycosyltransferase involved in cell wall biosynthesis
MGGGGAERQLAYLAGPLASLGWEVHTALVEDGPNLVRLQASGAVIHRLSKLTSYDPRLAYEIARVARRVRPDLIQTWFVKMDVIAGPLARLFGVPWILSERSSILAYPPTWKNRLRVAIAKRADAIICNSAGGAEYWHDRSPSRTPTFVIPNAVPVHEIEAARTEILTSLGINSDQSVVVCIGRFGVEKNIDRVFDALSDVVRRPRTVGIFCGDGPLRRAICDRIAERGLAGRLLAPGYICDLWPLLKRANVVVAGSLFEGRPNAVIEAIAAGRPLVVSDIPAHREILDDTAAVWVDPCDAGSIAAGVRSVLEDREAAERRAAVTRSSAMRWSTDSIAAEYDRVYQLVLSRRGRN